MKSELKEYLSFLSITHPHCLVLSIFFASERIQKWKKWIWTDLESSSLLEETPIYGKSFCGNIWKLFSLQENFHNSNSSKILGCLLVLLSWFVNSLSLSLSLFWVLTNCLSLHAVFNGQPSIYSLISGKMHQWSVGFHEDFEIFLGFW